MVFRNTTWKEFTLKQVLDFCNKKGFRTFSLKEFNKNRINKFREFKPNNNNIEAKIRQQLQILRDEGFLTFVDNSGNYTLRSEQLLLSEKMELSTIELMDEEPKKREYLIETYVRKTIWAKRAIEVFGDRCLLEGCKNTFLKDNGNRYIEVHHIVPLFRGGENGLWNLSVLCAHHHKEAHFSKYKNQLNIQKQLQEINERFKLNPLDFV